MNTEYSIFGWPVGRTHDLLSRVNSARRIGIRLLVGLLFFTLPSAAHATKAPAAKPNPRPQQFYAPVFEKKKYGDATSINDRCPVKHGPLNPSIRPSYVNRQTVGYCCHGCPPQFTLDPAPFLQQLKLTVPDPVDPRRVASYDPKLRVFLNQETYFFAGPDTKKKFLADPLRYAGTLTDPVSQKPFTATRLSPHMKYKDRTFYFESQLTERQFAVAPQSYSNRREE